MTDTDINLIVPGDIIIGPNGSTWTSVTRNTDGQITHNGAKAWTLNIGSNEDGRVDMAIVPREGATVAALQDSLAGYPDRIIGAVESLYQQVNFDDSWFGDSPAEIIKTHGAVVRTVLVEEAGISEKDANNVVTQYETAIEDTGITDSDALKQTRAGHDVLRAAMQERIAPVMEDTARLETYLSNNKPMHRTVFLVDLNGDLIESEDLTGAAARLHMQGDLDAPVPADLSEPLDDLDFFAQKHADSLPAKYEDAISSIDTIDQARDAHHTYVTAMADHLGLKDHVKDDFINSYDDHIAGLSLPELQDAGLARAQIGRQITAQAQSITPETLNNKAQSLRDAYYSQFDDHAAILQQELDTIAQQTSLSGVMSGIRFELAKGTYTFGGGTTGAEARVASGAITVSHTMVTDVQSGKMDRAEFRRHLTEEIRHTIDLKAGVSAQHAAFVQEVYNDPAKNEAWSTFAQDKHKSPPSYYEEYGGLETEFLVDILDMEEQLTAKLGSQDAAQARITETFGAQANTMLSAFKAEVSQFNSAARGTTPPHAPDITAENTAGDRPAQNDARHPAPPSAPAPSAI